MKTIFTTQILALFVALMLLFGWIANVVKAVSLDYEAPYKTEVIRVIGIFAPPVGGIVGYIKFEEEENND